VQHAKPASLRNKLRSIRLVRVTVVALQILLNDKYKLNHSQLTIVAPPLDAAAALVDGPRSQRPWGASDRQGVLSAFGVVSVSGDRVVCGGPWRAAGGSGMPAGGAVERFALQLRYSGLFSFFMLKVSSRNS